MELKYVLSKRKSKALKSIEVCLKSVKTLDLLHITVTIFLFVIFFTL